MLFGGILGLIVKISDTHNFTYNFERNLVLKYDSRCINNCHIIYSR